jgi:DNA-binding LacI/PurR family transcriptional regulator
MKPVRLLSAAEQVAAHLRSEILRGVIFGEMKGIYHLAAGLVTNHKTVNTALLQLEKEGLLVSQGSGRPRKIVLPETGAERRSLRVAILKYDAVESMDRYSPELLHSLLHAGHAAFFSGKSLIEMGMNLDRVIEHVKRTDADVWVVTAGSGEVLEWFAKGEKPAFALFGRRQNLPIAGAGPKKAPVYGLITRRLIELGHRRIVLLTRSERRFPEPGASEREFLKGLAAHGIPVGPYHLPDWDGSVEGFHSKLRALFQSTPPTALIVDEAAFFLAAMQFLRGIGLRVPRDVSLICTNGDTTFSWFQPTVSHIDWDTRPVVRRVVRWAANIARGKDDRRQNNTKAVFIEGGTIGPAKG